MAAEAQSLVERYRGAGEQNSSLTEQVRGEVLRSSAPRWGQYSATKSSASILEGLEVKASAQQKKAVFDKNSGLVKACLDAISITEDAFPAKWVLTAICDMLREDNSCYSIFDDALHKNVQFYDPLLAAATRQNADQYVADKAAWLLTAIMGNLPFTFTTSQATKAVEALQKSGTQCSELGVLEAVVNMLKADVFRCAVWGMASVPPVITTVSPLSVPPYLYKCVFAMWLLSFEEEGKLKLPADVFVTKIRQILVASRVEKVVRLALTVLKSFLGRKEFGEEVVEQGVLEVVQQLEYEKWRDAELYEEIHDLASQIMLRVTDMSSFERYERELKEGNLKWGFIHSNKFWADNVLKFEQNDFGAIKLLAGLLGSSDSTTLAVACHDIGEFVASHPLGKKQIASMNVKERIMELMSSSNPEHREVRREALLACQKIMLNKWQDMDAIPK